MKVLMGVMLLCVTLLAQNSTEPVPSKWLHDGKLVAEDLEFSVASPTADAHWSRITLPDVRGSEATAFVVDFPIDKRYLVIAWGHKGGRLDSSNTKVFLDGMRESMPKDWHVDDAQIEPSTFPLKNSAKITIPIHLPNGAVLYA